MVKKIRLSTLILLLCSIIIFVSIGGFFSKGELFNNLIVDEQIYNSYKQSLKEDIQSNIQIKFEGYELFFDEKDNRYYYSLVENNPFSHNPRIEIEKGYKVAIKGPQISDELIKNNDTINFIIYNDKNYREYNLTCTTLPLMNLDYDGDSFFYDDQPMFMTLFDNQKGAINRITKSNGNVRLRGIFTAGLEKQGLRLTLLEDDWWTERDENLLDLRRDGDWILYAGYNDVDKVRNVFCENLWNETCSSNNLLNAHTGTEYKYLELFINNEYYGLYALCYPIDAKELKLKKDDALYQPYMNQFEDEITYENYEIVKENMRLKFGERWDILIDYYENLFDSYNKKDINAIKEIIDVDNAIDSYIFLNFIQGNENALGSKIKNIKIAIKKEKNNYKCIYIPWDFDMSLGNSVNYDSKNNTDNYSDDYYNDYIHEYNPANLLVYLGDDSIKNKIHNRYIDLRKEKWSNENITYLIRSFESKIYGSGAYFRDMKRWPNGSYTDSDYTLKRFREYVINRLEYLDEYYK